VIRKTFLVSVVLCLLAAALPAQEKKETAVKQDQKVLRFASRILPWYPDSTFKLTSDTTTMTPSGAYRIVQVKRECRSQMLSAPTNFLIDVPAKRIWMGSAARLPEETKKMKAEEVKAFVSDFLPELMMRSMRMRAHVVWDVPAQGPSALIPFDLMVDSGFGESRKHGAITADFSAVLLGAPYPFDRDPVAYRREVFSNSDLVMWDHPAADAKLTIVEFSDFECPGCRVKWPLIKSQLKKYGTKAAHGMVNFPLPSIHPWAFRAATGAWCLSRQNPAELVGFKEHFYNLQRNMEVALVRETSNDYVSGIGLDPEIFKACYLKDDAIAAVHRQMELGSALGIQSTPTYFFNGWMVQIPDVMWIGNLAKTLIEGSEPAVTLAQ